MWRYTKKGGAGSRVELIPIVVNVTNNVSPPSESSVQQPNGRSSATLSPQADNAEEGVNSTAIGVGSAVQREICPTPRRLSGRVTCVCERNQVQSVKAHDGARPRPKHSYRAANRLQFRAGEVLCNLEYFQY